MVAVPQQRQFDAVFVNFQFLDRHQIWAARMSFMDVCTEAINKSVKFRSRQNILCHFFFLPFFLSISFTCWLFFFILFWWFFFAIWWISKQAAAIAVWLWWLCYMEQFWMLACSNVVHIYSHTHYIGILYISPIYTVIKRYDCHFW